MKTSEVSKAALAFTTLALCSGASPGPAPFTWQEAQDEALSHNADIQAAESALRTSRSEALGKRSGFLPRINATATHTWMSSDQQSAALALSAEQNLFNGFQDTGAVGKASLDTSIAEIDVETARAQVLADLARAYDGVESAQRSEILCHEILARRQENQKLVELRFESGRENKGSVLLAKAYLRDAEYGCTLATHLLRQARRDLTTSLGREDQVPEELAVEPFPPLEWHDWTSRELDDLALGTRSVRQARLRAEAATRAVTVARGGYWPELNVSGSAGYQGARFASLNDFWKVGASVSLPLFSGLATYSATHAASAARETAEARSTSAIRAARATLERLALNWKEALQRERVDVSFLEALTLRAEIARGKYNTGLLSFDQWDLIESDLIARQKAVVQSRRNRTLAEIAWKESL